MLAREAPQNRFQVPHARLSRAALRHLALLLLLTPLLGGLRVLIGHVDQRAVHETIVVRELVEVPRTEYVQIEVPVPTVIVVDVSASAAKVTDQASLPDTEGVVAGSAGDSEATADQQPDPSTEVTSVPAQSYETGLIRQTFETQPAEDQSTAGPLAEAPPGETDVVAEAPPPASLSPAQQALADFYAYTEQNWSVQGYSSAEEMRDGLGNSTTGWLNETRREASAAIDSAEEVAEREVPTSDESEASPEPIVLAQPTTNSAPSLDGFYAYTEQNWSALGYSSAEEMRRSLGVD